MGGGVGWGVGAGIVGAGIVGTGIVGTGVGVSTGKGVAGGITVTRASGRTSGVNGNATTHNARSSAISNPVTTTTAICCRKASVGGRGAQRQGQTERGVVVFHRRWYRLH